MAVTLNRTTIDDLEFPELDLFPTVETCQRILYGVRPGVSSPRTTPLRPQPCGPHHGAWLQSLWCFAP
jgi:hypothetical protein